MDRARHAVGTAEADAPAALEARRGKRRGNDVQRTSDWSDRITDPLPHTVGRSGTRRREQGPAVGPAQAPPTGGRLGRPGPGRRPHRPRSARRIAKRRRAPRGGRRREARHRGAGADGVGGGSGRPPTRPQRQRGLTAGRRSRSPDDDVARKRWARARPDARPAFPAVNRTAARRSGQQAKSPPPTSAADPDALAKKRRRRRRGGRGGKNGAPSAPAETAAPPQRNRTTGAPVGAGADPVARRQARCVPSRSCKAARRSGSHRKAAAAS